MAFNRIIKASNVWHNKCPEHLFTDMLYKGKQQEVKGWGGGGGTHTLTHYAQYVSYITLFLKEIN